MKTYSNFVRGVKHIIRVIRDRNLLCVLHAIIDLMSKQEDNPLDYLPEITQHIRSVSDPEEIILFGSYARGDYGSDSDLDLLIIKDQVESPNEEAAKIYRALAHLTIPVDVVVVSKAYVKRYRNIIGTVLRPAFSEGKVIYAR